MALISEETFIAKKQNVLFYLFIWLRQVLVAACGI